MNVRKGMMVSYHPTPTECGKMREHRATCNISEELPAVVVALNDDGTVNLKVLHDGIGDQWAQSVLQGDGVGEWDFYSYFDFPSNGNTEDQNDFTATLTRESLATSEELKDIADSFPEIKNVENEIGTNEDPALEPKPKTKSGGKKV